MRQLDLLDKEGKQDLDKGNTIKLGNHSARIYTHKKNAEARQRLKDVLTQLEGKDILISQYCDYWWYNDLRLKRLHVTWYPENSGLVLCGTGGAQIRILWLKALSNFREQYIGDKPYYLLDFWNGFRGEPLESYHQGGYQCLTIKPSR